MDAPISGPDPARRPQPRLAGPKVVLAGFLIVIVIATFIATRMIQTREPTPDPDSIPERPTGEAPG